MKKVIAVLLSVSICLFTGCSIFESTDDGSGRVNSADIKDGIYIVSAKGEYFQPNTNNQNFDEIVDSADKSRVVWSVNGDKNIPTLYKDDKLVYFSTQDIPDTFRVEQFQSCGYTIGVIGLNEMTSGGVSVTEENIIRNSSMAASLAKIMQSSPSISIYAIDDHVIKANSKIFNRANTFTLDEGSTHKVSVYAGTYYGEMEVEADTRVWSSCLTTTTAGYARTTDGYIEVLYGELEDGYYSFEGTGLIHIVDKNRP